MCRTNRLLGRMKGPPKMLMIETRSILPESTQWTRLQQTSFRRTLMKTQTDFLVFFLWTVSPFVTPPFRQIFFFRNVLCLIPTPSIRACPAASGDWRGLSIWRDLTAVTECCNCRRLHQPAARGASSAARSKIAITTEQVRKTIYLSCDSAPDVLFKFERVMSL